MTSAHSLSAFIADLRAGEIVPRPADEPWPSMIARISVPGQVAAIGGDTFEYFLQVIPPHYHGHGFAFAEGAEPLRYFWHTADRYFCRQLTEDETVTFCSLAGIPLPH